MEEVVVTLRRCQQAAPSQLHDPSHPKNGSTIRYSTAAVAAGAVVFAVLVILVMVTQLWVGAGGWHLSSAGWFAMVLGVVVALGLGIGLMALVFFSNRRGYDELAHRND
jgi:hypothetical protein